MEKKITVSCFCLIVLSAGLKTPDGIPPILYEDYKTFQTPRTGHAPGYVFRIPNDDKNKQIFVTELTPTDLKKSKTQFVNTHKKWKGNVLLNFIGLNSIIGGANLKSEKEVQVILGSGNLEQISEEHINTLLAAKNISIREKNKYYVVSETISVDSITYNSKKNNFFGIKLAPKVVDKGDSLGISYYALNDKSLTQKFAIPHRVLYKILEFNERGTKLRGNSQFDFKKTNNIYIK